MAISTDSMETQRKFKAAHDLPYPLLSDEGGKVAKLYGGTVPVVGVANRATWVVAQDGKIVEVVTGGAAIDPGGAITSCPVGKKGAG